MVYKSVLALGYEPVLYVYYDKRGVMIDKLVDFSGWMHAFARGKGPILKKLCTWKAGFSRILKVRRMRMIYFRRGMSGKV